jgi:hypothetical protein
MLFAEAKREADADLNCKMTSADLLRAQCPVPRDPTVLYENMLKAGGYCSSAAHCVPVLPTIVHHIVYQCSPRHPLHVVPVLATSCTAYCTGARHVIHCIVYRCLPRDTPHIVYGARHGIQRIYDGSQSWAACADVSTACIPTDRLVRSPETAHGLGYAHHERTLGARSTSTLE